MNTDLITEFVTGAHGEYLLKLAAGYVSFTKRGFLVEDEFSSVFEDFYGLESIDADATAFASQIYDELQGRHADLGALIDDLGNYL